MYIIYIIVFYFVTMALFFFTLPIKYEDLKKRFDKLVAKTRYNVERVFGSMKSWFKSLAARFG